MTAREWAIASPSKRFESGYRAALVIGRRFCSRRGLTGLKRQEAMNSALIGLWKASISYSAEKGIAFFYWMRRRVIGALLDHSRRNSDLRRYDYKRCKNGLAYTSTESESALMYERRAMWLDGLCRQYEDTIALRDESEKILGMLTDTERRVVQCIYWRGLTMRETGKEMGFTESYICGIHKRMIERLRRRLGVAA